MFVHCPLSTSNATLHHTKDESTVTAPGGASCVSQTQEKGTTTRSGEVIAHYWHQIVQKTKKLTKGGLKINWEGDEER